MKDTRQTPPPRGEDNGKEKDSGSTEGPKADGGLRVVAQGSIQRGHPTKLVSLQDRLNSIRYSAVGCISNFAYRIILIAPLCNCNFPHKYFGGFLANFDLFLNSPPPAKKTEEKQQRDSQLVHI